MTDQKGLGSKFLGLFVQVDGQDTGGDEGGKTAADLVAEIAGQGVGSSQEELPVSSPVATRRPAAAAPAAANLKLEGLAAPAGTAAVDFEAVFREAGMDPAELDRVKKAEELLRSLPEATPQAVKKQIVEASLKAFGFEIEKIVAAAQNQRKALDAYVRVNESATAKAIQDAEAQIRTLNEKIAALRADIDKRTAGLSAVSAAAQGRKADVQKVLEFFQGPPSSNPSVKEQEHS